MALGRERRGSSGSATQAVEGDVFNDRYRLTRAIGQGGFGVVFEARDLRLDKRVAVKVLRPSVAERPAMLVRFIQEAIAAARIGHPNIVNVTDVDRDGDTHFMVMEYIEGVDLRQAIAEEAPFSLARSLSIAAGIAHALAATHRAGIVHRDLKPGNVLLTVIGPVTDFVKVLDFGISKMMVVSEESLSLTAAGEFVGTPRYMAPEQALNDARVDQRADIYALGVILYEMSTGRAPHSGSTPFQLLQNKSSGLPPPPSHWIEGEVSAAFDQLLLQALDPDPERRFPTMDELAAEVLSCLEAFDPAAARAARPAEITPRSLSSVELHDSTPVTSPSVRRRKDLAASVETRLLHGGPAVSGVIAAPGAARRGEASSSGEQAKPIVASQRRRIPKRAMLALAAASIATVALVAWMLRPASRSSSGAPTSAAYDIAPATPAGIAATPPAASNAPVPTPVDAGPRDDADAALEIATIHLVTVPANATVEVGGIALESSTLRVPTSRTPVRVEVTAPGYAPLVHMLTPLASGELKLELRRLRKKPPPIRLPDSPL